jgi:hypothetical protein
MCALWVALCFILVSIGTIWPLFMGRRNKMLTFSETWNIVKLLACFMKLRFCFDLSSRLTRCPIKWIFKPVGEQLLPVPTVSPHTIILLPSAQSETKCRIYNYLFSDWDCLHQTFALCVMRSSHLHSATGTANVIATTNEFHKLHSFAL